MSPHSWDTAWDSRGTSSLKAFARKVLSRDTGGTVTKSAVPSPQPGWDTSERVSQPSPGGIVEAQVQEHAALVEYGAGVPREGQKASPGSTLHFLLPAIPPGNERSSWTTVDGSPIGGEAAAAGWQAVEVFGVHPKAPNANHSLAGLVPLIGGGQGVVFRPGDDPASSQGP